MNVIEAISLAAIMLHGLRQNLSKWEREVDHAERMLIDPTPKRVMRICAEMRHVHLYSDIEMQQVTASRTGIEKRAECEIDIPGGREMATKQAAELSELAGRLVTLRSRLRSLYGKIGQAVSTLRDQPIDERLARVMAGTNRPTNIEDIVVAVRQDHHDISDANWAWRTMHDSSPGMQVVESTRRDDIIDALKRMEAAGTAVRYRKVIKWPLWSFPAAGKTARAD